jgi:hypothetical protein
MATLQNPVAKGPTLLNLTKIGANPIAVALLPTHQILQAKLQLSWSKYRVFYGIDFC